MGYEAIRLQRPLAVDDIVSVHYFEYSSNYYFEGAPRFLGIFVCGQG